MFSTEDELVKDFKAREFGEKPREFFGGEEFGACYCVLTFEGTDAVVIKDTIGFLDPMLIGIYKIRDGLSTVVNFLPNNVEKT